MSLVRATEGLTASGAVVSAFGAAASWICCLPFVLGGLGAGSAGLAAVLTPVGPLLPCRRQPGARETERPDALVVRARGEKEEERMKWIVGGLCCLTCFAIVVVVFFL